MFWEDGILIPCLTEVERMIWYWRDSRGIYIHVRSFSVKNQVVCVYQIYMGFGLLGFFLFPPPTPPPLSLGNPLFEKRLWIFSKCYVCYCSTHSRSTYTSWTWGLGGAAVGARPADGGWCSAEMSCHLLRWVCLWRGWAPQEWAV